MTVLVEVLPLRCTCSLFVYRIFLHDGYVAQPIQILQSMVSISDRLVDFCGPREAICEIARAIGLMVSLTPYLGEL